jgi:hypothetical protein
MHELNQWFLLHVLVLVAVVEQSKLRVAYQCHVGGPRSYILWSGDGWGLHFRIRAVIKVIERETVVCVGVHVSRAVLVEGL